MSQLQLPVEMHSVGSWVWILEEIADECPNCGAYGIPGGKPVQRKIECVSVEYWPNRVTVDYYLEGAGWRDARDVYGKADEALES